MRLDWSDVRLANGNPHIIVQKGKVKKRSKSRRIVEPLPDNLKAWMASHAKPQGPVWNWSEPLLYKRLQKLAAKAETLLRKTNPKACLEWKSNALRHSFISYRMASVKNENRVAIEAGNSPQMIFSNYRELVTEQDAQRWFAIMPSQKPNRKGRKLALPVQTRKASKAQVQTVAVKV
jgi:integrase